MFKRTLFAAIALFSCTMASAQFFYNFRATTGTYAALTSGTSMNGSTVWDEENFTAPMPFSWQMDSTITLNEFNLALWLPGAMADTNDFSDGNAFLLSDADAADRSIFSSSASSSPIRYLTTGTAPFRIFKVEMANAGFYDEGNSFSTMNDFFNVQVWIYETTNIVEFHYGTSQVSHGSDYFSAGSGPVVGYLSHVDFNSGATGNLFSLSGNPTAPSLDSLDITVSTPTTGLNSWPANGTIYRFVPKGICETPQASFAVGSPGGNTVQYTYNGSMPVDSVLWDFGDGNTSKLMNPSHTFAVSGRYNVCVTAFNPCGNNKSCATSALAVGNLASLGNVNVYPNPAKDYLRIEGMTAGGNATVLSVVGQTMLSLAIDSERQHLDIATLPAGIYRLVLRDKNGNTRTVPFVKQ